MEENKTQSGSSKFLIITIVLVFVIAIGAYGLFRDGKEPNELKEPTPNQDGTTSQPVETINTQTSGEPVKPVLSTYKDGSYSAMGDYISPGGAEQIGVSLTLKNDTVTSADVVSKATRPNSIIFQGKFISGFKQYVVGKDIDTIQLDKVSGSSLTPKGFNDALEKIKVEAKA